MADSCGEAGAGMPEEVSFVPLLKEVCVEAVASQFDETTLSNAAEKYHVPIVDQLPLDLPLELAGAAITQERNEKYWKLRSQGRWTNCDASQHGGSFKQLFFERNLQDVLEEFDIEAYDLDALKRLLAFSSRYVQALTLDQLPSHLNLEIIFDGLSNSLTALRLRYGMRAVGMDYDRALFGMKLSDCRSLARCLEYSETLVRLDLRGNLLDDDKLRMLASGLINNLSVVHLDLSHNRIADRGVRALAKLLHPNSVIQIVELGDNQIHTEGGRAIARALRSNVALCRLNLRLNRLGDEGGRAILDVTRNHPRLDSLDLAHNGLASLSVHALCKCLTHNSSLWELDLSGNDFNTEGGSAIREVLETNQTVQVCSLTRAGIGASDLQAIKDILQTRAEIAERKKILKNSGK